MRNATGEITAVGQRPPLRARRLVAALHLWLGLTLGAVWALQGLTGALLVFHRELDAPAAAALTRAAPRQSLDRLITAATQAHSARPESVGLYYPAAGLLAVTFPDPVKGTVSVVVDPASASVVTERQRSPSSPSGGNAWRWIYNFHHSVLLGEMGERWLGASGLVLLAMAGSGAWLGWPRRGQWRAAFAAARWRSRLQQLFGWHRAAGLVAGIGLVLLAGSGALMDFGKPLRSWAERHAWYRPAFQPTQGPVPDNTIGAEAALARALAIFPDGHFVSVSLPSTSAPVYQVRLRLPGEWRSWSGTSLVVVEPVSGRVLDSYDAAHAPLVNRILDSAFAVHCGEVAGLVGRILTLLAGLTLPLLYGTGLWIWLRKGQTGGP